MGATTFHTEATGKTADEAFRNAVNDAYYWHGHGGYSGTIAEKSGYELWLLPSLPPCEPVNASGYTPDTLTRYANACDFYMERVVWADKPVDVATIEVGDYAWEVLAKADALVMLKGLGAGRMKSLCHVYNDKWGSAVAVKLSDDTFGFFGWASC